MKLFSKNNNMRVCSSIRAHVNKMLYTKSILCMRNEGSIEPVLTFTGSTSSVVYFCQFEIQTTGIKKGDPMILYYPMFNLLR